MDMNSPHNGQPDDRADDAMTGVSRMADSHSTEGVDANDRTPGGTITPRVELYIPPTKTTWEMTCLSHGRRASERLVAVDDHAESPPRNPSRQPPLHHAVASPADVLSHDSLLGMHITGFRIDRLICSRGLGAV